MMMMMIDQCLFVDQSIYEHENNIWSMSKLLVLVVVVGHEKIHKVQVKEREWWTINRLCVNEWNVRFVYRVKKNNTKNTNQTETTTTKKNSRIAHENCLLVFNKYDYCWLHPSIALVLFLSLFLSLPNQMECPILVIEVFSIYRYLLGLPALGINNENWIEENNFPPQIKGNFQHYLYI